MSKVWPPFSRVYLGVRTSQLFLCFVIIVRVRAIMLTSLFSLFDVTGEFHRFLHRGRAIFSKAGYHLSPEANRLRFEKINVVSKISEHTF